MARMSRANYQNYLREAGLRMSRAKFMEVLSNYPGVTIDTISEDDGTLQIDTPKGKVFRSNGCHTIVEPFSNRGGQSWKPEAYAQVADYLRMGLEDCTEPDCDVCEER